MPRMIAIFRSCLLFTKNFSLTAQQPKWQNSCSKMWSIEQLYIELGFLDADIREIFQGFFQKWRHHSFLLKFLDLYNVEFFWLRSKIDKKWQCVHITVFLQKKQNIFSPLRSKCLEKCSQIQNSGFDEADISLNIK